MFTFLKKTLLKVWALFGFNSTRIIGALFALIGRRCLLSSVNPRPRRLRRQGRAPPGYMGVEDPHIGKGMSGVSDTLLPYFNMLLGLFIFIIISTLMLVY